MIHCEKIVSPSRVTAPSSYGLLMIGLILSLGPFARCEDSLAPFTLETVPRDVRQLWDPIDFGKDPLETSVVREWEEAGVTCRYVLFTVGTFKGKKSRCAAFYTFPTGMKKGPAFVWAHGGGQRADRQRGLWFARQGYATIDINWGGREMVPGIEPNTDWGAVDPSQGPRFYAAALRPQVKLNLLPDQHTIDPVVSPRNGNWFLLAYAGRRAPNRAAPRARACGVWRAAAASELGLQRVPLVVILDGRVRAQGGRVLRRRRIVPQLRERRRRRAVF